MLSILQLVYNGRSTVYPEAKMLPCHTHKLPGMIQKTHLGRAFVQTVHFY